MKNRTPIEQEDLSTLDKLKARSKVSTNKRMIVLLKKTISDIYKLRGLIITIFIMVVVPVVSTSGMVLMGLSTTDYGSISPFAASMTISFGLVPLLYFWTLGLVYSVMVGAKAAGTIADEVTKGTMLMLVSKPISRIQIFFGKYIAIFLYGLVLSFFGIYLSGWISVLLTSGNIIHFVGMIPFLNLMLVYSLFVEFIFLTISMALSSIMKKGRTAGVIIILLAALTYIVFLIIKFMGILPLLIAQFPEVSMIYYLDLGYHFGNVFYLINNTLGILPNSVAWQINFNMYAGIFMGQINDSTQDISLGGSQLNGYVDPFVSLLILIGLTFGLLLFGLNKLRTKEISN